MTLEVERTDEVAALALLAVSAGVFWVSRDYPTGPTITPGAAFFPRLVAAGIAALAVVLLVQGLLRRQRTHEIARDEAVRAVVPLALLGAYVAAMSVVGFLAATVAFLLVLMRYSGVDRLRVLVPVAVGLSVVLQYAFVGFLHVPLPQGEVVALARYLPDLPI